ncbi:hypothetical protein LUZ60_005119 [Juncus effusus]|nr:hypothetical protein LUZ60_005119 [Juncus effusus]
MKATFFIFPLLLLSSLFLFHSSKASVTCGEVESKAISCLPFVTGRQARPALACCSNLKMMVVSAKTLTDKRATCQCLQNGVKAFPGVQDRLLSRVPALCGVKISFPMSMKTNCNKIN